MCGYRTICFSRPILRVSAGRVRGLKEFGNFFAYI